MTDKITLGLIDDDTLFTEALTALLRITSSIDVRFNVSDGLSLFRTLAENDLPDVLLCDLKLKEESGLDLLTQLQKQYPSLRVIALSSFYKPVYVAAALRNGFAAFLPKNCSSEELVEAIRRVHATGVYFRSEDIAQLRDFLNGPADSPLQFESSTPLSKREKEILCLICGQYTNAEIAEKLFISIRTVENHRNRIHEKTGVHNSAGLVVFAITNGLLDLSELKLRNTLMR